MSAQHHVPPLADTRPYALVATLRCGRTVGGTGGTAATSATYTYDPCRRRAKKPVYGVATNYIHHPAGGVPAVRAPQLSA